MIQNFPIRLGILAAVLWLGLGMVLLGAGRGDPAQVLLSGTVRIGGVPLQHGTIFFQLTSPSRALVVGGAKVVDGEFQVPETDPIIPGTYHVRISGSDSFMTPEMAPEGEVLPPDPVPETYNAKSILDIVIPQPGRNVLSFDLAG